MIWKALQCLLVIFRSRILRCSQGKESVQFSGDRIMSLIFADEGYLLASSSNNLQRTLGRFAA